MNNKVGIERCGSYDAEELYRSLKAAAQGAGLPEIAGKKVLLKPNILMDALPEKAVTTHPAFLEACIRLVKEWGASRILVGDSPGLQGPHFTAKSSGLNEAAVKNGAEWVDFTREKTEIDSPDGKVHRRFTVSAVIKEVDCVISLPKLKTHQLMYFTGAMKNIFGLIPSVSKSPYHVRYSSREAFASMIVDLNLAVKPVYAFMDAVTGMEGAGPAGGTPKHTGLVMASANLLAMDFAACRIIGYPPERIPINREALLRQVWLKDFAEIEYPSLKPEEVKVHDFVKVPFKQSGSQLIDFVLPKPLRKLKEARAPRPVIDNKICVRCGDCIKMCASSAMSFSGAGNTKQVEINYSACIRCYCCHEICQYKAIDVKKVKK